MELNDIKKALYKQQPLATLLKIDKNGIRYRAPIQEGPNHFTVAFVVPFSDIGDAIFEQTMYAKHLIRWIITN